MAYKLFCVLCMILISVKSEEKIYDIIQGIMEHRSLMESTELPIFPAMTTEEVGITRIYDNDSGEDGDEWMDKLEDFIDTVTLPGFIGIIAGVVIICCLCICCCCHKRKKKENGASYNGSM